MRNNICIFLQNHSPNTNNNAPKSPESHASPPRSSTTPRVAAPTATEDPERPLSRSSDLSSIEEEEEVATNAEPLEPIRSVPNDRLTSRPIATYPRSTELWQREPPMPLRPARFHALQKAPLSLPPYQYYQGRVLTIPYHGMITSGEKRPHEMSESTSIRSFGFQKPHSPDDAGSRSPIQPSAPKRIILSEIRKPKNFDGVGKPLLYFNDIFARGARF